MTFMAENENFSGKNGQNWSIEMERFSAEIKA